MFESKKYKKMVRETDVLWSRLSIEELEKHKKLDMVFHERNVGLDKFIGFIFMIFLTLAMIDYVLLTTYGFDPANLFFAGAGFGGALVFIYFTLIILRYPYTYDNRIKAQIKSETKILMDQKLFGVKDE